jgi:hypothetical protein
MTAKDSYIPGNSSSNSPSNAPSNTNIGSKELYEKNMAFFSSRYPGIYNYFLTYQASNSKLIVDANANYIDLKEIDLKEIVLKETDLKEKDTLLYGVDARQYCQDEVNKFIAAYPAGSTLAGFNLPGGKEFDHAGLFFEKAGFAVKHCPISIGENPAYHLGDFYPLLVVTGVGLGFHLEALLAQKEVHTLILVENKLSHLASSFYCIDWARLLTRFNGENGCSFTFVLALEESDDLTWNLWNELITFRPMFPLLPLFYNHRTNHQNNHHFCQTCEISSH